MELRCVMARRARLLSALRRELRISDGLVRRLKPLDAFRVNGESAHTDRLLVPGDVVTVRLAEAAPDFPAEDGPLDILWEDECLIAVDKPAGLIVHPTFSRQSGTLANYLLGHYRRTGQACGVHVLTRLDRDTMGVVVFAKSAWAHWLLMEELDRGQVEKVYEAQPWAIVCPIYQFRASGSGTLSSSVIVCPQGICATACCTNSPSGYSAASFAMYFKFRTEYPVAFGNANLMSIAKLSTNLFPQALCRLIT